MTTRRVPPIKGGQDDNFVMWKNDSGDVRQWMHRPYPASPIPAGQNMAGNYHYLDIEAAHTPSELADFNAWMNGQTMIVDDQGQTVIFARDDERWCQRTQDRRSAR